MIYAFDTFYLENKAKTACIGFEHWKSVEFTSSIVQFTDVESDYISGAFYKRELPCILDLLSELNLFESTSLKYKKQPSF